MSLWYSHGTKILGVLIALLAGATLVTPDQLAAYFGENAPRVALAIAGGLTFLRGFKNAFTQGSQEPQS